MKLRKDVSNDGQYHVVMNYDVHICYNAKEASGNEIMEVVVTIRDRCLQLLSPPLQRPSLSLQMNSLQVTSFKGALGSWTYFSLT